MGGEPVVRSDLYGTYVEWLGRQPNPTRLLIRATVGTEQPVRGSAFVPHSYAGNASHSKGGENRTGPLSKHDTVQESGRF